MSPIHVSTESARPRLIAASKSAMETHKFSVLSFPGSKKKKAYQQINAKERQYMNQEFVQHMVNMDFPNKKIPNPLWANLSFLTNDTLFKVDEILRSIATASSGAAPSLRSSSTSLGVKPSTMPRWRGRSPCLGK